MSWVSNWFINWTGSISIGMLDNKVSRELSSESGEELSKDCERWSSVGSTSESSGDGEDWSAAGLIGANCGKWITVAALHGKSGGLMILV